MANKSEQISRANKRQGITNSYDVLVIGSGFGGAITACRLAQAGRSVCVLEKGKRWNRHDFPRGPGEVASSAIANDKDPSSSNGFIEYKTFRNIDIIQGTGVGGGSLHYFNVHKQAPEFIFDLPAWPSVINLKRLTPYYNLAADMLAANTINNTKDHDIPRRTQVFEDAVNSLGLEAERVPICVHLSGSPTEAKSACDHCGNCLLGCNLHAKNTLDLNYLAIAEAHGTVVLAQHEALNIIPTAQGYTVSCRDLAAPPADHTSATFKQFHAQQVIVAAGTLGSNELLLRCKYRSRTLPRISKKLGKNFSGNGDFLLAGTHFQSRTVEPGRGPSITSGVGFNKDNKQYIYIEDLGLPDPFIWYFNNMIPTWGRFHHAVQQVKRYVGEVFGRGPNFQMEALLDDGFMTNFLPYLGMGTDAADGTLSLDKQGHVRVHWSIRQSLPMFQEMIQHMKDLSRSSGGRFINSLFWETCFMKFPMHKTLTAHPLGGCAMSDTPLNGVANDCGEVWGYKGLYIADGSLIPAAIGVNPSATISAIAERVAFQMIHQRELQKDDALCPSNTFLSRDQKTKATSTPYPKKMELSS